MHRVFARGLVAACFAAAIPLMASAQAAKPAAEGAAAPQATHPHAMQHHKERAFSLPSERAEARLAYVKTALKISGGQEAQWNAYADVMRTLARERDERVKSRRAGMKGGMHHRSKPTAIERLERQQAFHAAAVVRLNAILPAQKALYAALTQEQKGVADEVLSSRGPGMPGHRFGRGTGRA
jgi:hypothetical protein